MEFPQSDSVKKLPLMSNFTKMLLARLKIFLSMQAKDSPVSKCPNMLNLQVNTHLPLCIIKYISDAYPQTVTGKIKKFELREQAIDDFPELKDELE